MARAIADYTEALRLDPQNAEAYARRGAAWRAKGDVQRADSDLGAVKQVGTHAN